MSMMKGTNNRNVALGAEPGTQQTAMRRMRQGSPTMDPYNSGGVQTARDSRSGPMQGLQGGSKGGGQKAQQQDPVMAMAEMNKKLGLSSHFWRR